MVNIHNYVWTVQNSMHNNIPYLLRASAQDVPVYMLNMIKIKGSKLCIAICFFFIYFPTLCVLHWFLLFHWFHGITNIHGIPSESTRSERRWGSNQLIGWMAWWATTTTTGRLKGGRLGESRRIPWALGDDWAWGPRWFGIKTRTTLPAGSECSWMYVWPKYRQIETDADVGMWRHHDFE